MAEPVQYDDDGRPVMPRFANRGNDATLLDAVIEQTCGKPRTRRKRPTEATATQVIRWLDDFHDELVTYAEWAGIEPETVLLVFAGFVSQKPSILAMALDRDIVWVTERVRRLLAMGIWGGRDDDGRLFLGGRFGAWMEDTEQAQWETVLDLMVIEGILVCQECDDGEMEYALSERECKSSPNRP